MWPAGMHLHLKTLPTASHSHTIRRDLQNLLLTPNRVLRKRRHDCSLCVCKLSQPILRTRHYTVHACCIRLCVCVALCIARVWYGCMAVCVFVYSSTVATLYRAHCCSICTTRVLAALCGTGVCVWMYDCMEMVLLHLYILIHLVISKYR